MSIKTSPLQNLKNNEIFRLRRGKARLVIPNGKNGTVYQFNREEMPNNILITSVNKRSVSVTFTHLDVTYSGRLDFKSNTDIAIEMGSRFRKA